MQDVVRDSKEFRPIAEHGSSLWKILEAVSAAFDRRDQKVLPSGDKPEMW